jgi:hypothetical protein
VGNQKTSKGEIKKMEETLAQKLAKKNICLVYWARNKKLSIQDIYLLRKISNGTVKGARRGRTRELVDMLQEDGLMS